MKTEQSLLVVPPGGNASLKVIGVDGAVIGEVAANSNAAAKDYPRAVIVAGPPRSGKTRNAQLLAALFGKDTIVELEEGCEQRSFPDNYLVLTNDESIDEAISLRSALRRLERAHLIAPAAMPRFCRDCKHARYDPKFATCSAPEVQIVDVVHGLVNQRCESARHPAGKCGIEARLFVQKPVTPPRMRSGRPQ